MANWIITAEAQNDIDCIIENVIDYTSFLSSGIKLFEDFQDKFDLIAYMPYAIGRAREDGKREAFCRGYRIVYSIINDTVYINTVIHSRRLYPRP